MEAHLHRPAFIAWLLSACASRVAAGAGAAATTSVEVSRVGAVQQHRAILRREHAGARAEDLAEVTVNEEGAILKYDHAGSKSKAPLIEGKTRAGKRTSSKDDISVIDPEESGDDSDESDDSDDPDASGK